jgi:hypothetical protein
MCTNSLFQNMSPFLTKVARLACGLLTLVALPVAGTAQSATKPIPSIEKQGETFRLLVDGNPYLMLGARFTIPLRPMPRTSTRHWTSLRVGMPTPLRFPSIGKRSSRSRANSTLVP